MMPKRWQANSLVCKALDDGWTYYARLLEFPWVAFYRHRTKAQSDQLEAIAAKPALFTIAAHKDLLAPKEWRVIGSLRPDPTLGRPKAMAMWDVDTGECHIIDDKSVMHPATLEQCKGLEPAAVWEPEHIDDRLKDEFAGRPNHWLLEMLPPQK
jgi:hypothetical protein